MKTISERDVKFLLKEASAGKPTLVVMRYRYNNQHFSYSTGQRIDPTLWDSVSQRARISTKSRIARQEFEAINATLDRHRSALMAVLVNLRLGSIPLDNSTIKAHLDSQLQKPARQKRVADEPVESFTNYILRFIDEAKRGTRLNDKSKHFAEGTLRGYKKLKVKLEKYQKDTGGGIGYADYSLKFYDAFVQWQTDLNHSPNYIGSLIKDLKLFLERSHAEGLHTNSIFKHKEFKVIEEEVETIYLTKSEINTLHDLDLSKDPKLDRARDMFLIGCYTGLRFSDYSLLRAENINGRLLTITTRKTSERVSIPISTRLASVLAKYGNSAPVATSNQRLNANLKTISQRAKLTTKIQVEQTRGGKRHNRFVEKWEMVSTHTARRSFATNAYLDEVPPLAIMKMTGHKSEKMLLKYIKITSEQNALTLLNHAHFQ